MLKKCSFLLLIAALGLHVADAQTKALPTVQKSATFQTNTINKNVAQKSRPAVKPVIETGFEPGINNLDYKWVIHGSGTQTAAVGDYGEMNVVFKIGDTTIINTDEMNDHRPVLQPIAAPSMKGDLMEGIVKMKAGDSVIFRMKSDTFFARTKQPKPAWVKSSDYIRWEVKMARVLTKAQLDAETAGKEKAQKSVDDKLLQDYFAKHNIKNAKKTASGLYYVVLKNGTGQHPLEGQDVSVNYTGQNMKGEKFDSNTDSAFNHVEPLSFALGKHNVINGWDEAIALMNKGMKATFYIPSGLAYGDHGQGPKIGPNEILIFDIELLSFK